MRQRPVDDKLPKVSGDVVAVIPIVSATLLFTLLMTFLDFGRETITWRTITTIVLIVGGIVVVLSGGRSADARRPQGTGSNQRVVPWDFELLYVGKMGPQAQANGPIPWIARK